MAKQPEDQNIKSRARRRLIGAIALTLAVVVILPMVLDSEPKITGQDIELRIPAADKAGEFVPGVTLSEVIEAPVQIESAVAGASETLPAASGKITVAEVKDKPVVETPVVAIKEAEVREVKPVETRPVEDKKIEKKPVSDKPSEKTIEKPSEKLAGSYVVQVGAFSNAEKAAQEADKLKGWGFKAYTEVIAGTTRVRVGPYVDLSKADEVRKMLEKHDLHPAITAVK